MAKPSNSDDFSDETPSSDSTESDEEQKDDGEANEEETDEEELEAVARTASPDEDEESQSTEDDDALKEAKSDDDDDDNEADGMSKTSEIGKRERARLRELERLKKQKIQEILDAQNAAIDADMNNKGKGRLKYLLQQTEIFAHFAKGAQSATEKKQRGRGRHASKLTEEEEDEVYLKEEEGGLAGAGGTRLVTQPSCIQGKMRDYQLAGLNWLIRLYENGINGILADEMGLGKTLQTISLLGYLREFRGITGPHMVVAPKSTLGNWMKEIRRFCPVLRAVKFLGNPDERKHIREDLLVAGKFDICVTSFEMAIKEKTTLRRFSWRYVIIDEAHRIKNENSLLSKTMRLYNTNYRLLITGTPLQSATPMQTSSKSGPWRKMLSSKDVNFVGYTYKNFEIVNDHNIAGIAELKKKNNKPKRPSIKTLFESEATPDQPAQSSFLNMLPTHMEVSESPEPSPHSSKQSPYQSQPQHR